MIIKNGRVFQEDGTFAEKDLYIEGKRFVSTKEEVIDQEVIDAKGWVVGPGFMDLQCQQREPGQEAKEEMMSGSNSAAAGGFTRILEMANTRPAVDQAIIVAGMTNKIA